MVAIVCASAVVAAPEQASADTPDIWRNNGSRRCLYEHQIFTTARMTPSCSAQYPGHHFHVHQLSSPSTWYRIVSNASNQCLTVDDVLVDAVNFDPCVDGDLDQFWVITRYSGNRYTIKSAAWGTCLTTSAAKVDYVWLASCPGGNRYQEWVRD